MPPHHHKKHCDKWWSELPESAKKAAAVLQYTQESWDADAKVPYDGKSFEDCTTAEKHAALYLGLDPIVQKLDPIYWKDVTATTQQHAMALGWDAHKWDHDWALRDLPVEHLYWKDLNEDQRAAAIYFGWSPVLWDETGDEEVVFGRWSVADETPAKGSAPKTDFSGTPPSFVRPSGLEEKKDEEEHDITATMEQMNVGSKQDETGMEEGSDSESEEEEEQATAPAAAASKPEKKKKKKNPFRLSKPFGSAHGATFDHSNHRHINSLKIWADRHCIHGMEVTYSGGVVKRAGNSEKGKMHEFQLASDEYINGVKVRANQTVQSLAFQTTKKRWIGPVGGKGWLIGQDKAGEEVAVKPFNKVLSGLKGRASDDHLHQIVFSWGPVPGRK